MKRLWNILSSLIQKLGLPFLLFALAVFSFGLLIPFLGFYSDDWTFVWLAHRLGPESVMLHYVSNRPFLGFLTIPIVALLGDIPWHYHVFALLSRFASALVLVWLISLVWPQQKRLGIFAGIIFLLYPGLTAWPVALMTGEHYYLVFSIFLLSLCFSFLAIRRPHRRRLWVIFAWIFSLLNLLFSEYYFFLELTRPFFLWVIYTETIPTFKEKLRRVIIDFGPFLIEFCLVLLWRMKYFPNQQGWYQVVIFDALRSNPMTTILDLFGRIGRDLYTALVPGMVGRFGIPDVLTEGNFSLLLFPVALLAAVIAVVFLFVIIPKESRLDGSVIRRNWSVVLLAGVCLLMAGPTFWVTNLSPSLTVYYSRFFVPFTLGASLLFAGILNSFSKRIFPIVLVSFFVCIATGSNFRMGNDFRIDWKEQQRLFWNIAWRIPSLPHNTLIISNEIPSLSASNTYLTTIMNWMYDTDPTMDIVEEYYWEFEENTRLAEDLQAGTVTRQQFRSLWFSTDLENVLFLDYENGCLVVLEPELDGFNPLLSDQLRDLAVYSHPAIIDLDVGEINMIPFMFDEEGEQDWCYDYSRAEVFAQQGDWDSVVQIFDAVQVELPMKYSAARFYPVFIEGLALTGQMDRAAQITSDVVQVNPYLTDMMCYVWQRLTYDGALPFQTGTTPEDILIDLQCTNH